MSKSLEGVLKQKDYEATSDPYVIEQVAQAALQAMIENARRREQEGAEPQGDTVAPEVIDPVVAQMRAEMESLKEQAQQKLDEASREAETVKQAALDEAVAIKARAKEEGYQEGLSQGTDEGYQSGEKKGQEEGLRQWAEQIARWQSILEGTIEEKRKYFTDREAVLVKLVFETAAKVLHREIKADPDGVLDLIKAAVSRASDRSHLVIHLNPEDIDRAREADETALNIKERVKQIEFQADETVTVGGVRVEAGSETIDASLDLQLARIARGLMEVVSDDAD